MDELTDDQRAALTQFREMTNGGDDEVAISMLQSVDWDVQKAAEMIFGAGGPPPPRPAPIESTPRVQSERPMMQPFDGIDDSEQGPLLGGRGPPQQYRNPVISVLSYPLHIISSIFRFVFGILRIPIPYIPFLSLNFYRNTGSSRGRGRGGPERWIRELEEETGAICIGKAGTRGVSSGLQAGVGEAGPSTLTARTSGAATYSSADADAGRKYLPDFALGTYDQFLRVCSQEARIGCVVLVSDEHDDVPDFKRNTLTDPTFVNLLTDNNIHTWGGDVRDTPAFTASLKLQSTTYPYVAFVGLQPARNSSSSSSNSTASPTLSILSRHQGAAATTAEALCTHLTETLLPRVQPYLARIKTSREAAEREKDYEEQARQAERALRAQQDRAFEESARRDRDRILAKIREDEEKKRVAEEERRRAEEEERKREEEERERVRWENERMGQRKWLSENAFAGGVGGEGSGELRVAVRMPDGRRLVRRFRKDETLSNLYAFVDVQFLAPNAVSATSTASDADSAVQGFIRTMATPDPVKWWGFRLASAYPRKEIPWSDSTQLASIPEIAAGGGQLVVEMVSNGHRSSNGVNGKGKAKAEDHDGYDTESDDE
ncbi:UBX domain-containing protein 10 [Marasmius crinis-equi]|uniref:UBX domain-containing protein 10 n=1 Tax=Marasmius crinis-equi TaxID=585013 RepID=A0ABR3EZR0_9AGAR